MKKTILSILLFFAMSSLLAQISIIKSDTIDPTYLYAANGKVFYAHRPVSGAYLYELWVTDGTSAGSYRVKDINPNSPDDLFSVFTTTGIQKYSSCVFNNELYFMADDGVHGMEFWKSDGTAAGTNMFYETTPGLLGWDFADSKVPGFCVANGTLFFKSGNAAHGYELWKTDGTTAGTVEVSDIYPGPTGSNPYFITSFNGKVFFTAKDNVHGWELFCSDGTDAGTHIVKDIAPGVNGAFNDGGDLSIDPQFKVSGDYLYFVADNNGVTNVEPHWWRTDGTDNGTIQLETTLEPYDPGPYSRNVTTADLNGELIFVAGNPPFTNATTWKSDGTVAGTTQVFTNNGLVMYPCIMSLGSYVYFNGVDNDSSGMARTDGTTSGTDMVFPYDDASSPFNIQFPSVINQNLFFHMSKYFSNPTGMHARVVQSNGTAQGTIVYPGVEPLSKFVQLGTDIIFYGHDTTEAVPQLTKLYKLHPAVLPPPIGTGVSEKPADALMDVFPNPASTAVHIGVAAKKSESITISLINTSGARVLSQEYTAVNGNNIFNLELKGLSGGFYIVEMNADDALRYGKLVKQ
jgi:ELWxxDGT repeat protein